MKKFKGNIQIIPIDWHTGQWDGSIITTLTNPTEEEFETLLKQVESSSTGGAKTILEGEWECANHMQVVVDDHCGSCGYGY